MDISKTGFAFEHDFDIPGAVIYGYDFVLGDGLYLVGNDLYGRGRLSGVWGDGTSFSMEVVPEPCTLLFLGLGGLLIKRK